MTTRLVLDWQLLTEDATEEELLRYTELLRQAIIPRKLLSNTLWVPDNYMEKARRVCNL